MLSATRVNKLRRYLRGSPGAINGKVFGHILHGFKTNIIFAFCQIVVQASLVQTLFSANASRLLMWSWAFSRNLLRVTLHCVQHIKRCILCALFSVEQIMSWLSLFWAMKIHLSSPIRNVIKTKKKFLWNTGDNEPDRLTLLSRKKKKTLDSCVLCCQQLVSHT